jgi:hypothetical protein
MMRSVLARLSVLTALTALLLPLSANAVRAQVDLDNVPIGIYNVIESVDIVDGQLVATTVQGQQIPIDLSARRQGQGPGQGQGRGQGRGGGRDNAPGQQNRGTAECPILDLSLGPIQLNVLGLDVATSPICLAITAYGGPGNLLGNLLCGIAGLLDAGNPLDQILAGLTDDQRTLLLDGLRDILNGATNNVNEATVESVQEGVGGCPILNLVLGPLDLNLLGLQVYLHDCNDGPVEINVAAIPGGGLLGNLLCAITDPAQLLGATLRQFLLGLLGDALAGLL